MLRWTLYALLLVQLFSWCPVWAQDAHYHLQRLQIQANVFLESLPAPSPPGTDTSATIDEQLNPTSSVWSRQMIRDDVGKIITAAKDLEGQLDQQASPSNLLAAKTRLESLSSRLRVSSAALNLSPQSQTALNFLFLELEESARLMHSEREQLLTQERTQRTRRSVYVGVGIDYPSWGYPYDWGSYYPYGYGFGPGPYYYPGFPNALGPRCW